MAGPAIDSHPEFFTRTQIPLYFGAPPFIAREALDSSAENTRGNPRILSLEGDAKELLLSLVEGPPDRTMLNIEELLYRGNSASVIERLGRRRAYVSGGHWFELLKQRRTSGESVWAGGKPLYAFLHPSDPIVVRTAWFVNRANNHLSGFNIIAYRLNDKKTWECGDEFITYESI